MKEKEKIIICTSKRRQKGTKTYRVASERSTKIVIPMYLKYIFLKVTIFCYSMMKVQHLDQDCTQFKNQQGEIITKILLLND